MCGDLNATTTFTPSVPNLEMPLILPGHYCACGLTQADLLGFIEQRKSTKESKDVKSGNENNFERENIDVNFVNSSNSPHVSEDSSGINDSISMHDFAGYPPSYDMWMPCTFFSRDPWDLQQYEHCIIPTHNAHVKEDSATQLDPDSDRTSTSATATTVGVPYVYRPPEIQRRLFLIHSTTNVDRLTLKSKIYASMANVYGKDMVALVMPRTFNLAKAEDKAMFKSICVADPRAVFIMKDENLHRQLGLNLASGRFVELSLILSNS